MNAAMSDLTQQTAELDLAARGGVAFGDLADSLGFLLRLAQLEAFANFYEAFAALEMRPGHLTALVLVERNPGVRQGVLARALKIKRAHMTKMIGVLEGEGLISRTVPDDDKRSVELWISDLGSQRIEAMRGVLDEFEKRAAPRLTARESEQLKRLLRKYIGLSDGDSAPA